MIVLDTNIVSELVKTQPNRAVAEWARRLDRDELVTTTVTLAEMRYGLARLPAGKRKRDLESRIETAFVTFARQVAPFDTPAALLYGDLVAGREASGMPIAVADGMIAAICRARGATLATRNTADFQNTGVPLINPWDSAPEH